MRMRRRVGTVGAGWLACALLPGFAAAAAPPPDPAPAEVTSTRLIDGGNSRVAFSVHPVWADRLEGHFDPPEGSLETLADGRLRVQVSLSAASASFPGSATSTRWMRSEAFFDAARHPAIRFRSQPFPARRLQEGGSLEGELELRGVVKPVTFMLVASCTEPGTQCPIHAEGKVGRNVFGMTRMRWLVGNDVGFAFDVRLLEARPSEARPPDAPPQAAP